MERHSSKARGDGRVDGTGVRVSPGRAVRCVAWRPVVTVRRRFTAGEGGDGGVRTVCGTWRATAGRGWGGGKELDGMAELVNI